MSTQALARPTTARAGADTVALRTVLRVGFIVLAAALALMTLAPLLVLLKVSISAPEDVMTAHPPFWIYHSTLENWQRLLTPETLLSPARHSLVVATGTAVLAVLIAA